MINRVKLEGEGDKLMLVSQTITAGEKGKLDIDILPETQNLRIVFYRMYGVCNTLQRLIWLVYCLTQ